jgi:hypothetical protein
MGRNPATGETMQIAASQAADHTPPGGPIHAGQKRGVELIMAGIRGCEPVPDQDSNASVAQFATEPVKPPLSALWPA